MSRTNRNRTLEVLRLSALGLNAWLVVVLIPWLLSAHPSVSTTLVVGIPLVALSVGLLLLAKRETVGAICLLSLFPVALVVVVGVFPELGAAEETHPPTSLLLGAASLVAFLFAAAGTLFQPREYQASEATPLEDRDAASASTRRWLQRGLIAITALGASLIAIVAPNCGGSTGLREEWGASAEAAGVLTSVVAAVVAIGVLGLFVAPAMRAERRPLSRKRYVGARVASLILVALLGAAVLWMMKG